MGHPYLERIVDWGLDKCGWRRGAEFNPFSIIPGIYEAELDKKYGINLGI